MIKNRLLIILLMIFTTLHAQDQLGSREIKFSERAAAIEFRAMLVKNDSMIKPTMQMIISEALVRQDNASPTHYDFDPDSLFIVSKKLLDNMLSGVKAPVSLKFKITAFNALNQFFGNNVFSVCEGKTNEFERSKLLFASGNLDFNSDSILAIRRLAKKSKRFKQYAFRVMQSNIFYEDHPLTLSVVRKWFAASSLDFESFKRFDKFSEIERLLETYQQATDIQSHATPRQYLALIAQMKRQDYLARVLQFKDYALNFIHRDVDAAYKALQKNDHASFNKAMQDVMKTATVLKNTLESDRGYQVSNEVAVRLVSNAQKRIGKLEPAILFSEIGPSYQIIENRFKSLNKSLHISHKGSSWISFSWKKVPKPHEHPLILKYKSGELSIQEIPQLLTKLEEISTKSIQAYKNGLPSHQSVEELKGDLPPHKTFLSGVIDNFEGMAVLGLTNMFSKSPAAKFDASDIDLDKVVDATSWRVAIECLVKLLADPMITNDQRKKILKLITRLEQYAGPTKALHQKLSSYKVIDATSDFYKIMMEIILRRTMSDLSNVMVERITEKARAYALQRSERMSSFQSSDELTHDMAKLDKCLDQHHSTISRLTDQSLSELIKRYNNYVYNDEHKLDKELIYSEELFGFYSLAAFIWGYPLHMFTRADESSISKIKLEAFIEAQMAFLDTEKLNKILPDQSLEIPDYTRDLTKWCQTTYLAQLKDYGDRLTAEYIKPVDQVRLEVLHFHKTHPRSHISEDIRKGIQIINFIKSLMK